MAAMFPSPGIVRLASELPSLTHRDCAMEARETNYELDSRDANS